MAVTLPAGVSVFERGWLSCNNVLIQGAQGSALIDSSYCIHADQTLALVDSALQGRPLDLLLNTHLHSDHCGGNAALQARYPALQTHVPPGQVQHVLAWDTQALSYAPTGQQCPRFSFSTTLQAGGAVRLGHQVWQVHAAAGHDMHSVIFFEPQSRTLISGDALWEKGFGIVFPELDGEHAFDAVAATLDVIERLNPVTVIPGHGAAFTYTLQTITYARQRLDGFVQHPAKHLRYAAKVLLKFKLLEARHLPLPTLMEWARNTAYFQHIFHKHMACDSLEDTMNLLLAELVRSGAARVQDGIVFDA